MIGIPSFQGLQGVNVRKHAVLNRHLQQPADRIEPELSVLPHCETEAGQALSAGESEVIKGEHTPYALDCHCS